MGKRTREDDDQSLNHGKSRSMRRRVTPGGGDSHFDRLPDDVAIQIPERLNLESLFIENAFDLGTLEVSSQSLKWLEFCDCDHLNCVNIGFARNLEFFKQMDGEAFRPKELCIKGSAPKLSDVCLQAPFDIYHLVHLHKGRVEKLEVHIGYCQVLSIDDWMSDEFYPRLADLKELKLTFDIEKCSCFFLLILSLILPACPQLQKLTLYYNHLLSRSYTPAWYKLRKAELCARSRVHECLKVVEFGGWSGLEDEVEAANLVKEIAPNLEKITYG